MFYDVRVFDADMKIKKTITSQQLTHKFWQRFHQNEKKNSFTSSDKNKIPDRIRKNLVAQFPDLYDPSYLKSC